MSWKPITLKGVSYFSPTKKPAEIRFERGLNVISGATDTGKSFILETIDFMLASSYPVELRDFHERVGYNQVRLLIETVNQSITLERHPTMNSNFSISFGGSSNNPTKDHIILPPNPRKPGEESVSSLLLSEIEMLNKSLLFNKSGELKTMGFRQLVPFVLINEEKIIKSKSPILGDQVIHYTRDYSTFKLLLTGLDASSLKTLEVSNNTNEVSSKTIGNLTLIEELINEIDIELANDNRTIEQLEKRANEIAEFIAFQTTQLNENQTQLNLLDENRQVAYTDQKKVLERIEELVGLFSRFELLKKHYEVDLRRLAAIEESGSIFYYLERVKCPLCGAEPIDRHVTENCDGDIEPIIKAAQAEGNKIKILMNELSQTVSELTSEYNDLLSRNKETSTYIQELNSQIEKITIPGKKLKVSFQELVEEAVTIRSLQLKYVKRTELELKRNEILKPSLTDNSTIQDKASEMKSFNILTEIPDSILDKYSQKIQHLLANWHFPNCERVYFDTESKDLVINGKKRGSRGKGLRAIVQAAMTIGLMEYCKEQDLSHPGFVVIDSPLLGYYEPDGEEDSLKGTDLKERFYEYLRLNHNDCQIIIIENEDPPPSLPGINITHFTKNPKLGRYGFFPKV